LERNSIFDLGDTCIIRLHPGTEGCPENHSLNRLPVVPLCPNQDTTGERV